MAVLLRDTAYAIHSLRDVLPPRTGHPQLCLLDDSVLASLPDYWHLAIFVDFRALYHLGDIPQGVDRSAASCRDESAAQAWERLRPSSAYPFPESAPRFHDFYAVARYPWTRPPAVGVSVSSLMYRPPRTTYSPR